MAAHTPGPWRFTQPYAGFSAIHGPNDELIFGIAAGESHEKQPDDVCEANARLITAAPECRTRLQETNDMLERLLAEEAIADIDTTEVAVQIEYNRAALSNAKEG